jgi:hypothetical protein
MSLCLTTHQQVEVWIYTLVTSAVDGGEWLVTFRTRKSLWQISLYLL